ncbi:hypothetical protein JB92DRAFT_1915609 [Gautieria morchelliformis]|nr:hypothetical protein JB92DRAFT_1915609 [Gautieria morchelliformis]
MNSLSRELIDIIIDHVDEDDIGHSRLRDCSLVCRFWLPSIQRRLFHHINLSSRLTTRSRPRLEDRAKRHAQIQRLDQVLLNSPHLISYIRVLELPALSGSALSAYPDASSPVRWTKIYKPLSLVLRKLTHLQKLKISGLDWRLLTRDFRQLLCQVLELPSMAFVSITKAQFRMADLTNFINHARGLTGLSLNTISRSWIPRRLDTKPGEDNDQRFERNSIHLTSLDVMCRCNNSAPLNWLLEARSHFDVSHVHTLHIAPRDPEDGACVNRLLRAIGSSLKHVSIIQLFCSVLVNLAFNVNIDTLSFVCEGMQSDSLSNLRRVLSTIDASNGIHRMELRMNDYHGRGKLVHWEEVCSVLAGPQFQFLRVLYINIVPGYAPSPHCDFWTVKGIIARHPLLVTRGVRVSSMTIDNGHCIFCSNNPWN